MRRGEGIPAGKKVLIVLDQFEQWLHAQKAEEAPDLVQSLRQCDGGHVQCIVMVRDDFWMAATRFMRSLEIRLLEAENSNAVDLFPLRHAEKVLAAFGRAFGDLPEGLAHTTKDQKNFLTQAVHDLAEDGKVICVRLALFAEMLKGKPWTPATLKEVGGTAGVGVTFLEETFSASTAPPEHRYHQKAARAVLKTLLPESGTQIKGLMRSREELLEASGYAGRPDEFNDLIHILDRELRLITPTDPEGSEEDSSSQAVAGKKYYQLTHDYLVPSLRDWLTRKQRETRRGRAELRLSAEITKRDAECRKQSLRPVDLSGCTSGGTQQYAVVWGKASANEPATRLEVGLDDEQWQSKAQALHKEGYRLKKFLQITSQDGKTHTSGIWAKAPGNATPFIGVESNYSGENHLGELQVDVQISKAGPAESTKQRFTQQLKAAEKALQANTDDFKARMGRAEAYLQLGEDKKALEDLSWLISKVPKIAPAFQHRAIVQARLGKLKEAKEDLAKFKELTTDPSQKAYVDAVVSAHLGEDAEGMKRLEAVLAASAKQSGLLYNAACACSLVSRIVAEKNKSKAKSYADRAVALLKDDVAAGHTDYLHMQTDPDLDPLRQHPGFLDILKAGRLDRHYTAIWQSGTRFASTEVHGLDPSEHLTRCRALMAQGYRPASFSVAEMETGQQVAASVWHRPVLPEDDKEMLAKRQANAAVALLKMGKPESVWPLLKHSPDPRVRSWIIHKLSLMGADPGAIVKRLEEEPDVSIRRALILSLGEFGEQTLAAGERTALMDKLHDLYRNDLDPGLHAAAEWLLRQWKQDQFLKQIEQEWVKNKQQREQRLQSIGKELAKGQAKPQWYVNGQGQTMVVIPGPVEFLMGSPPTESHRSDDERLHRKRIGRTFALATKAVTMEQFLRFRKDDYMRQYAPTADCPVHGTTWYEAAEYCNWLSKQEGLPEKEFCYEPNKDGKYDEGMKMPLDFMKRSGYRLPTESEWEYACRAGAVTSRYYGQSEELLGKYGWYTKNSDGKSWPVGISKPNDLGLFDMQGNVCTWCQDRAADYTSMQGGKATEDIGDASPPLDKVSRVLRGGGFINQPWNLRSALRIGDLPGYRRNSYGFRPARTYN